MNSEIKEEIKSTIIQSNKEIDFACNEIEEMYSRGWLGGNLEIVRILEKHYGKFIDDDEIISESSKRNEQTDGDLTLPPFEIGGVIYSQKLYPIGSDYSKEKIGAEKAGGDLISRTELLNKIWQKEYGKDYDGVNMLNIPHIDIIEQMPSAKESEEENDH
jgi:hypothetical protein